MAQVVRYDQQRMGKSYDGITPELSTWIERQRIFFTATATLSGDGLINCSPKGLDTFRILGPRLVAYMDLTGSGVETIAHSRENGRIVFMFCAFEGPPKIVRLHGTSEVFDAGSPEFDAARSLFPPHPGYRALIRARLTRISDSCGYGVPRFTCAGDRDALVRWCAAKGPERLSQYQRDNNARSLDGLPGLGTAAGDR
jgi:hypothetical protein